MKKSINENTNFILVNLSRSRTIMKKICNCEQRMGQHYVQG